MAEDEGFGAADQGTSLVEEIRLLVELVVERAAPWLEGVVAAGHGATESGTPGDPGEPAGEPDSGCGYGWCPLCAVVGLVRGERPELAARLVEQAAQLVALLRAVLADRWEPDEGIHMPGFRPPRRDGDEGRSGGGRVQHISVRRRAAADGGPR